MDPILRRLSAYAGMALVGAMLLAVVYAAGFFDMDYIPLGPGVDVTITGPDELAVNEADLYYVDGLTAEQFAQCSVALFPTENRPTVLVLQTLNNQPILYVKGRHAWDGSLILDVNTCPDHGFKIKELEIGGGPVPPDPPDPPDPPVPPPDQKWQVLIIHEPDREDNLPRSQQAILNSLTFRKRLKDAGHVLRGIVSPNAKVIGGSDLQQFVAACLAACEGDPWPRICLVPRDGGQVLDFALPKNEAATLNLLKEGKP